MAFIIPAAMAAASAVGSAATSTAAVAATSLATSLASGAMGAIGSIEQGRAAAAAANYNSMIQARNAQVANANAAVTARSGESQAAISEQKTRAVAGAIKANEAASGIDVNSGSALLTQTSSEDLGALDALTIRSNASRQAYGYETQAASEQNQSQLSQFEAQADTTAGNIGAASTILGSVGSATDNFMRYQINGGFGGETNVSNYGSSSGGFGG